MRWPHLGAYDAAVTWEREPSEKVQDTKGRWHSEGTGQLMYTNVASKGGGLLPFFLRPAPTGGDDGASRVTPHPSTTQQPGLFSLAAGLRRRCSAVRSDDGYARCFSTRSPRPQ